jgi:hypothetical protein
MVLASGYIATEPERKALEAELVSAYVAGLLSDSDLSQLIDSAEQNTNRDSLIVTTAKWKRLVKTTADLEIEYSTLFRSGLISDSQYRSFLSAIGLQDSVANVIAAKSEAQANATLAKRELADAQRLARKTQEAEIRAALQGFASGKLNAGALLAALVATGLTPIQAGAWVTIAELKLLGNDRWIYGMQLAPADAALLRQRVSALTEQRQKGLLSDPQFVTQLTNLKIPPAVINALQARADALLKASAGGPLFSAVATAS